MDDPLLVCGFEGFRDLPRHRQRIVYGNRPLRDAIGERGPLDQLQHERLDAVRFFKAVDRGDIRMVERREHLRLAFEAREPVGIAREELGKDLQRDVTIELRVTRTIDLAHAACAECRDDLVGAEARAGGQRHESRLIVATEPVTAKAKRAARILLGRRATALEV